MANKTVENPCMGTGSDTVGEVEIIKGKSYARCSACDKMVSINKANRKARKHNGIYQPTLWETFDEDIIFGRNSEDQDAEPVSAGSV